jgi:tRNA(Ile)-lysidine synthase
MINEFVRFVNKNSLFDKTEKLLVAVSGGIDSVVLLHFCKVSGYDVSVAHCNFGLRGDESDQDEHFVKKLSEKYNVPLFVKRCDAGKYARENKTGIQIAARELRYEYFNELVEKKGFSKVLIAHNADDDIESFFINLSRISGLKGLTGIPLIRDCYVRPLMFASRKQIETYAVRNNLRWREDSSNASDKYLRNRIRHHLIPLLNEISDDFTGSVIKTMQNLTEADTLLERLVNEKKKRFLVKENDFWKINLKNLEPADIDETLFYYILKDFGFNRDTVKQLFGSVKEMSTGKYFLSENHKLLLNRNELIISRKSNIKPEIFTVNSFDYELKYPAHLVFSLKKNMEQGFGRDKNRVWFDADKLKMPLMLRRWQKGDRFKPFGMKGTKLVSDLLIDEKLSLFEKENVFVLISDEKIIWVVGVRASDYYKVTAKTKNILEVKFFKPNNQ